MLVVGAKGHAIEILHVLEIANIKDEIFFFDNLSNDLPERLFSKYKILTNGNDVKELFKLNNKYILGIGNPLHRKDLTLLINAWGGCLESISSPFAIIGKHNVLLGKGLNIMSNVLISNNTRIGDGCLLNTACSIHHDVILGDYCEISPGARILGRAKIGNYCQLGANCTVLPRIVLGDNVTVGAGAVVTKNVDSNSVIVGVPARKIKDLKPLHDSECLGSA